MDFSRSNRLTRPSNSWIFFYSGERALVVGVIPPRSTLSWSTQRRKAVSPTSIELAASGMEYPWLRTKIAASILNSADNVRRCRFVIEHLIYGGDFTT
jgi:hypothetical protein